ncbi:hypothetical protein [Bdellovibrio svalbardensis]|uniref:DUF2790 domain-containing protein n=1 Tax=Bdellovibrio svalbardensis TaxID=2972972 RepID=A0ABT6DGF1_9BACT|nr:hypothetical protein [Bdellovibrio svalbardensis]MDG0815014.1 hypothetical protein [Bdellovibrio svalbardensis]
MKKLIAALLLVSAPAFAGRINEIVIMTTEDIEAQLDLMNGDRTYTITYQDFTTPEEGMDLAVQTKLSVRNVHNGRTEEWTCNTQFVKTPRFFDISKTVCN